MSLADHIFIDMCKDVIENGTSTEGEKVRPVWEDGTSAYTIKRFGVVNRYDLRKEFPALTLRKTALKSAMDEILWIWQKKSNNIHDLHSHIWDSWADENGSIGKAYGYQLGVKHQYKEGMMDQVDRVLYDLKNNPYSRRIMTNIYVHEDLHEMNLYPCAYSMTFNVTKEPGKDKLTLNAILNQRSQDILAANNWNVCQYSLLHIRIQFHSRCRIRCPGNQLLDNRNMSVINMTICNHMYQLTCFHVTALCDHHQQQGILAYIPVICRQDILGALVQNSI